jgi:Fur family transcriptional regulator, zinc uptake regulator
MSRAQKAVKDLAEFCKASGERLTPPREHVLAIVASGKKPLTAYEILEVLGKKLEAPKPPTAYRALDFLTRHGFIHRIESLNAYVACHENHKHGGSQFMICDSCGSVEEAHLCHLPPGLQKQTDEKGFRLSHWNAELHGQCRACRDQ